jgi:choline transport protein
MGNFTEIQMDTKEASPVHLSPQDTESAHDKLDNVVDMAVPERYRGTAQDKRDMLVHGKKQELRRNFKLLTMTGFASMVNITMYELMVKYRAN